MELFDLLQVVDRPLELSPSLAYRHLGLLVACLEDHGTHRVEVQLALLERLDEPLQQTRRILGVQIRHQALHDYEDGPIGRDFLQPGIVGDVGRDELVVLAGDRGGKYLATQVDNIGEVDVDPAYIRSPFNSPVATI
ncbi:hypothetical protein RRF57_012555 [Xylaria bambusicola]|uniref:Uncharacterized protein n=1 Tax=Xylaria bambusicola TaxID=326684 RepID=A0AAN7UZP4_9PEZI